eukprot:3193392-Pyramimonas_sp.AAC.1
MGRHSPWSAAFLEMTVGGSCLGSPTSTKRPPNRVTLSRDMVASGACACPASSMMSRATGAVFFSASADSWVAVMDLASLSRLVRSPGESLEGALPSYGNLPVALW